MGTEGRVVGADGVAGGTDYTTCCPAKLAGKERAGVAAQDICLKTLLVMDTARERQVAAACHSPRAIERLA